MEKRRMAGPFVPLPGEIFDVLEAESPQCFKAYAYILYRFFVEQDPDVEGEWVLGRIQASKAEIAAKVPGERSWFRDKIWPTLESLGLVREAEGGFVELPKLYKKAHQYLSPLQVTRRFNLIVQKLEEMETRQASIESLILEVKPLNLEVKPPKLEGAPPNLEVKPPKPGGVIINRDQNKRSLSSNNIISGFYRGIGQKRISKRKRERGKIALEKLRKEGFSAEDIAFAVGWTLGNAKEEPYDFSIIEHTIGQAIAAREKEEAEWREMQERERKAQEERERIEREEKEHDEIEAYKEGLDPDQREELREKAVAEIRDSGDYKEQFITEVLIEIKENEILNRRIKKENGEKSPPTDSRRNDNNE